MVENLLTIMLIARREHTDHQKNKKLIIGVITACCVTCTLIYMVFHRICRVCIKAPTVIAWAYQFISMLPASMCYAGSPCATLKCALLTFIITSDVSASCIPFVNTFCHSFRTMVVLEWYMFLCASQVIWGPLFCMDPSEHDVLVMV